MKLERPPVRSKIEISPSPEGNSLRPHLARKVQIIEMRFGSSIEKLLQWLYVDHVRPVRETGEILDLHQAEIHTLLTYFQIPIRRRGDWQPLSPEQVDRSIAAMHTPVANSRRSTSIARFHATERDRSHQQQRGLRQTAASRREKSEQVLSGAKLAQYHYEEGLSIDEICKVTGYSDTTILQRMKDVGLSPLRNRELWAKRKAQITSEIGYVYAHPQVLQSLTERQRTVLLKLYFISDLTRAEVAEELGVTVAHIKFLEEEGLKRLQAIIAREKK